ncbi:hypothetical protein JTB14_005886 [Gonioctena quinquepunctata]|nr:hypothetical protein JTB14_005886 [Gonioctena quinquepunctata]
MSDCKSSPTPMACGAKPQAARAEDEKTDKTEYQCKIVRTLHIFGYLKGSARKTLVYMEIDEVKIFMYTDASYANTIDDRKSQSGFIGFYGKAAVTWTSRKQKSVAVSSTGAEYMAHLSPAGRKNLHSQSKSEIKQKNREHSPKHRNASHGPAREQPRRNPAGRQAISPERPQKDTDVNPRFESCKPENALPDNRQSWRNTVVAPGNEKNFLKYFQNLRSSNNSQKRDCSTCALVAETIEGSRQAAASQDARFNSNTANRRPCNIRPRNKNNISKNPKNEDKGLPRALNPSKQN